MPVIAEDRPLDTLREQTIDQLIMNYGHGRLSLEAFERRLDAAFEATAHPALSTLTADLDLDVDAAFIARKRTELALGPAGGGAKDVEYLFAIFSGTDRRGPWTVPEELRLITVFGGADIDLTDARFTGRTLRIKQLCAFGGVDISIPEHVNVVVKSFCIFGGTSNRAPGNPDPAAPNIIIEGCVIFGGLDVKVKKPMRKRLREFAEGFRTMFGNPSGPPRE